MHVEGAQAVLSDVSKDMSLVWDANLELWGLVLGYHMEYIHPEDLKDMDEPSFKVTVHNRMQRYVDSLDDGPDYYYRN